MSGGGRLVCLAGVSGAGKDTSGDYLVSRHGFERVAIADPLKAAMMTLFGLTRDQLWGEARNVPDPRLGKTPRALYQQFGNACRELDADVLVRHFRHQVRLIRDRGGEVVCTDLRTEAEFRIAHELGGVVWKLERTGAGAPGALARHLTETALGNAPAERFDLVIRNDGTIAELHARLKQALGGGTA